MLHFTKVKGGYKITEEIHGFHDTETKVVEYTADLSKCKVNNDPWRDTTPEQRDWFNTYYRHKF